MLAPRNKLWSTPLEVIDKAIESLQIKSTDIIFDIGAGDGRFLTRCAEITGINCTGIEINEVRAQEAQEIINTMGLNEKCKMIVGNALEQDYSNGTVFYLYLVPRGLRLILPILKSIQHPIKVITYMSPFPETEIPIEVLKCSCSNHPDAMWPLYLYHLNTSTYDNIDNSNKNSNNSNSDNDNNHQQDNNSDVNEVVNH